MYNRTFWLAYAANTMLMVCVSLLFRYANFVSLRGGSELTLGLIVGVGMVGALAMRGILGMATDRYGARSVWMISLSLVTLSMLGHWALTPTRGPLFDGLVYLARILQMVGLAGAFGASLTFISLRAPAHRIGEMVGTLGSSGFIGLALGPLLGDWLFSQSAEVTTDMVQRMFLSAAAAAAVALLFTFLATCGSTPIRSDERPALLRLVRRYHPGVILICAAAMGIGVMLPHTFLQPYAEQLDIHRIRTFFFVYAATAFGVRILSRHFTDRHGIRFTAQLGFGFMTASMLSFIIVGNEYMLALPAALGGISHAFLFPAVVKGGSISFPARYRGLATTLVLAMFDVANLIGQPVIGAVVELAPRAGLPGYPTMFVGIACVMVVAGISAAWIRESPAAADERIDDDAEAQAPGESQRELAEAR